MNILTCGKIALFAGLLLILTGCKEPVLSGVTERQANEVIALLEKFHIETDKKRGEKNRYDVIVAQRDIKQAITLIDDYKLPSKEEVEVDRFFPTDALVASPRAEKARLISAIEQKLQQSLLRLDEVVDSRVHMSYPLDDDSRIASPPAKRISVLILHRPMDDATIFANKIRLFVLNSFPDVVMENITVVLFVKHETVLPDPIAQKTYKFENKGILILSTALALLLICVLWLRLWAKKHTDNNA